MICLEAANEVDSETIYLPAPCHYHEDHGGEDTAD